MKLVLDKKGSANRRKSRLQERFDKLRAKLDKERRRNERFRQDLDELVETYHRRSMENDQAVFVHLVTLSEKLITFAGRKSLSDWHREELGEWLMELVEHRISAVDPQEGERLRSDYREAVARSMDISVEDLLARVEQAEQAFGAQDDADLFEAEDPDDDPCQEDLFGYEEMDEFEDDADPFGPDWTGQVEEKEAQLGQALMDGRWAKDLFRRAAQALHPDREPDPERRQVKQVLMSDLLKARKDGDLMAILTIYSESVSDADMVLAEREMTDLCEVLECQLEELKWDRKEYVYAHPVRTMVHDLFYHSTKKARQRRFEQWEQEMQAEEAELRALVSKLRNLSCLKNVLADRRDSRSMLADILFEDFRF